MVVLVRWGKSKAPANTATFASLVPSNPQRCALYIVNEDSVNSIRIGGGSGAAGPDSTHGLVVGPLGTMVVDARFTNPATKLEEWAASAALSCISNAAGAVDVSWVEYLVQ